jgi:DNA-binding MarR family transcriptional regulator
VPDEDRHSRSPALLRLPGFALARLGRITRSSIRAAFVDHDLSARDHFVLVCLDEHGELSQRELADHLAMDRSDLVKVLDELERVGHIRRDPDPRDRRRHQLSITPAGSKTLLRGSRIVEDATHTVLARLTTTEQTTLRDLVLRALDTTSPAPAGDEESPAPSAAFTGRPASSAQ